MIGIFEGRLLVEMWEYREGLSRNVLYHCAFLGIGCV